MCKLLIVDDERIIREGLANIIDWDKLGITILLADNGLSAYEIIKSQHPDIVITDIKMPGLDGISLIKKVRGEFPDIELIILSGYSEFEFAKSAMEYGVKYYLLKPTREKDIEEIILKVKEELEKKKERERYINKIINDFKRLIPQLKNQFLKDFITQRIYSKEELDYYGELFNIDFKNTKVRLILGEIEGDLNFSYLYAFLRICEEILGDKIILSTTLGNQILILIEDINCENIINLLQSIKKLFYEYYYLDVTLALSEVDSIENTPILFREVKKYINYKFYIGEGSIITRNEVGEKISERPFYYNYQEISTLVRSGNYEEVEKRLNEFFEGLSGNILDLNLAKTYCLELYSSIIREGSKDKIDEYIRKIIDFEKEKNVKEIFEKIKNIALEISKENFERNILRNNRIVYRAIQIMEENLDKEDLSLRWVAGRVFINPDYLGKLFKKIVGEKFSDYLAKMRVERAKRLIEEEDYKIYEIAEKVGFGNNPQYFGQVFKKYTGYSPLEYKKILKERNEGSRNERI
jgi:two-component system response regulator YesN